MTSKHSRMIREHKTIDVMIDIFCHDHHQTTDVICSACQTLKDYAHLRLEKCIYQEKKSTCEKCPTHCYRKSMRAAVREVMRYSGPRMIWKYPGLALLHLSDRMRKPQRLPGSAKAQASEE